MKVILKKKPKNATIIEGFPGFGLVGTISTEYLIHELKAELIGYVHSEDIPPMVAIHENTLVQPVGVYYIEKMNLIILHVMTNVKGIEWEIGEMVLELAKEIEAKNIICIEGVGTALPSKTIDSYFYTNLEKNSKKFESFKMKPLKEGIILGVTATLMLLGDDHDISCIFVETHSNMPDSKAAAKAIETMDKFLGLKIDYKPLLKQAEKFEDKITDIMEKGAVATDDMKRKTMNYVG